MDFIKITEHDSNYNHLEKMTINELLIKINKEDKTVPNAVEKALPQIELLTENIVHKLKNGGRLFYTSQPSPRNRTRRRLPWGQPCP